MSPPPRATRSSSSSPANKFNSEWLTITMPLADDYTCGSSCWWKIRYQFSGTPTDRTTWSVNVIGDPVHLVKNA